MLLSHGAANGNYHDSRRGRSLRAVFSFVVEPTEQSCRLWTFNWPDLDITGNSFRHDGRSASGGLATNQTKLRPKSANSPRRQTTAGMSVDSLTEEMDATAGGSASLNPGYGQHSERNRTRRRRLPLYGRGLQSKTRQRQTALPRRLIWSMTKMDEMYTASNQHGQGHSECEATRVRA